MSDVAILIQFGWSLHYLTFLSLSLSISLSLSHSLSSVDVYHMVRLSHILSIDSFVYMYHVDCSSIS